MIIKEDKTYETSSLYHNSNWYEDEENYIIDETTKDGKLMAQIYIENYPFVDFEHDGEFVIKVIVLEDEKLAEEERIEQERLEQELLDSLLPSEKEMLIAEIELNIINLLLEMEVF
ncbi:hypothetical protein KQI38_09220 [Tissierella carlieri]|uniref:hypothetical protein n=1 Tax=Tissierella carlieri TaxID=689904 RepID=UPI001C0FFFC0|nr:hypothetical protein [Tissierella carlieri]MBU5312206.1 hypothetical protein [Tissierella carlieri]